MAWQLLCKEQSQTVKKMTTVEQTETAIFRPKMFFFLPFLAEIDIYKSFVTNSKICNSAWNGNFLLLLEMAVYVVNGVCATISLQIVIISPPPYSHRSKCQRHDIWLITFYLNKKIIYPLFGSLRCTYHIPTFVLLDIFCLKKL